MGNIKSVTLIEKDYTNDLEVDHPDHQYYLSNGVLSSNSHATLYSMTSFLTAYLKKNYFLEFSIANLMSEVKSNAKDAKDNISKIKSEIRSKKIKILQPNINNSDISWKIINDKKLMTGLDSLKFIGKDSIPEIIEKRPFTSFKDLIYRTSSSKVKAQSIQALAASGCLDEFGLDRKKMFYYASDYRAKLRSHMDKIYKLWERKWIKENNITKKEREVENEKGLFIEEYFVDSNGNVVTKPSLPKDILDNHLECFEYPFPEEKSWSIQDQYALEEFYLGEGISGDMFDRYPKFFDRQKTIPFEALKQMFPYVDKHEDERVNRKANTHYLGNHRLRPLEAVITKAIIFTVKKEDSKIFGQEMFRMEIQDAFGDVANVVCFPESWKEFKERLKELNFNIQDLIPGLAIRFLAAFQWENEKTASFIFDTLLDCQKAPKVPDDRKSRKVKMPRAKKIDINHLKSLSKFDLIKRLEEEALDNGFSTIDEID